MATSYKYGIHESLRRDELLLLIFIEETGKAWV